MTLVTPIYELFHGLERVQASLAAALFHIVKMKHSVNNLEKYINITLMHLENMKQLSGGGIIEAQGTIQRMNESQNYREGLILALEELKGAMPYIEKSIEELTKNAQVTQSHSEVSDRIAKVLKKSVNAAEINQKWNQIDVIQLTAFNTSMAKLMTLMVTTNNRANDLFEDSKNLFEILTSMKTYINKSKNLDKLKNIKDLLDSLFSASKPLIEEIQLTREILKNTKSASLLHPQTLSLPIKFGSENSSLSSPSHLSNLEKIVTNRSRKSFMTSLSPQRKHKF